jgi:hypothetical protein
MPWRTPPTHIDTCKSASNKACFWPGRKESILAHETRSSVLVDAEVSHLLGLRHTFVVISSTEFSAVPFRDSPGGRGQPPASHVHATARRAARNRRKQFGLEDRTSVATSRGR